jgi:hypothetical protein
VLLAGKSRKTYLDILLLLTKKMFGLLHIRMALRLGTRSKSDHSVRRISRVPHQHTSRQLTVWQNNHVIYSGSSVIHFWCFSWYRNSLLLRKPKLLHCCHIRQSLAHVPSQLSPFHASHLLMFRASLVHFMPVTRSCSEPA